MATLGRNSYGAIREGSTASGVVRYDSVLNEYHALFLASLPIHTAVRIAKELTESELDYIP